MNKKTVYDGLSEINNRANIREDVLMKEYTSFKVGGPADILVEPEGLTELLDTVRYLYDGEIPYMVIGNGSNIVFRDGGYRGVIVVVGQNISKTDIIGENTVLAQAGILLSALSKMVAANGLSGMEFASGIPGSLGGAVFMNAGAYGGEMKDILDYVRVYKPDTDEIENINAEDMDLSYRHSILQDSGNIILEAAVKLEKGSIEQINKTMRELTLKRNEKQPVNLPSAGSFFKRPKGYYAGKLIQDSGLKGLQKGGARISELHSGFMVNIGGATAADIEKLMKEVQSVVYDKFGVRLEAEVKIVGEENEV